MRHLTYLRSIIWGLLLGSLLFILATIYQIGVPTESSRWLAEIYRIKTEISNSIGRPKMVIVAGSNALFGISCQMIDREINLPCLNGATHAGLGIDYLVNRAQKWLKPNDLVLLPLEYEHYRNQQHIPSILVDYVFSRDINYLSSVDWLTKIKFFTGISLERVQRGLMARYQPDRKWQSFYNSKNLDEYGDEISNQKAKITQKQNKALDRLQPEPEVGYLKATSGMASIERFVEWCRQNRVKVFSTWPNQFWFDVYEKTKREEFQSIQDFYQSINVPLLGKPEDFRYDRSMYYDTEYHLNDRGVQLRTQKLIDLLKPYL